MAGFFSNAYELINAWTRTETPEMKLSPAELKQVNRVFIRDHKLEDGTVIKNVIFMMKSGKPQSYKLSPYNEQFSEGTQIDPSSIRVAEYTNEEGDLKYTATCEKA